MSRLQVGGLALIIHANLHENIGKSVRLISFVGQYRSKGFGERDDFWQIESDDIVLFSKGNTGIVCHPAQYLMPLGDKQTQDELAKEKEIENA